MSYSLGIDLGTTSVAAAVARPTGVGMIPLGDGAVIAPALVSVRWDGTMITGDAADRRAASRPDLVGREVKRRLGDPTPVTLGNQSYPVTALLGAQLRDVVRKVVDAEGAPPERVVLTHPANWGPARRELFGEVAAVAGLEAPLTVTEAEAAATHHARSGRLDDGGIIAVYDLGGATFDATVLRRRGEDLEVLAAEGIERLGGVDFDDAILSYVDDATGGALTGLDRRDPQTGVALARLRAECVLAKETLSLDTETAVPVFLPDRYLEVALTRAVFEDMVRAPLAATVRALSRAVRSAGLTPSDVGSVLLVGGSSRIPLVSQMLAQEIGRPTVESAQPKYAVALGAATITKGATVAAPAAAPVPAPHDVAPVGAPGRPGTVEDIGGPAAASAGHPGSDTDQDVLDPPTELLEVPQAEPPTAADRAPLPGARSTRGPLMIAATAVALLILALVYVLAPELPSGTAVGTSDTSTAAPPAPAPAPAPPPSAPGS